MFSVQLSDKSIFKLLVTSTKFSPQNQHLQGKSWSLVPLRFCGLGFSLQILQSEWFIWAAWVRFKFNPKPPLWSELHVVEVPRSVSPWHRVNYSFTFPEVFFQCVVFYCLLLSQLPELHYDTICCERHQQLSNIQTYRREKHNNTWIFKNMSVKMPKETEKTALKISISCRASLLLNGPTLMNRRRWGSCMGNNHQVRNAT